MLEVVEASAGGRKQGLIRLMAETLPLVGYRGVRADLPGWDAPELIHGVLHDHRPSLSCASPRLVLLDVLPPGPLSLTDLASRWQLFASAAEVAGGQFHVVLPAWVAGRDGRQVAKQIAELVGVRVDHVWAV